VANCGYMTSVAATRRGVARAMCGHSIEHVKKLYVRSSKRSFRETLDALTELQ
jgi:hypothetical protein